MCGQLAVATAREADQRFIHGDIRVGISILGRAVAQRRLGFLKRGRRSTCATFANGLLGLLLRFGLQMIFILCAPNSPLERVFGTLFAQSTRGHSAVREADRLFAA